MQTDILNMLQRVQENIFRKHDSIVNKINVVYLNNKQDLIHQEPSKKIQDLPRAVLPIP